MKVPANVFEIKTLADLRVFLAYVAIPVVVALLVGKGWVDENLAVQIGTAVIAAIPATLSVFTSTDRIRQWAYGLVGYIAPIMIAVGWITHSEWQMWLPVVAMFIGSGAAAQNAPTSTPYGEVLNRTA